MTGVLEGSYQNLLLPKMLQSAVLGYEVSKRSASVGTGRRQLFTSTLCAERVNFGAVLNDDLLCLWFLRAIVVQAQLFKSVEEEGLSTTHVELATFHTVIQLDDTLFWFSQLRVSNYL